VGVDVVARPLVFAQAAEQNHLSGVGCFRPTHGRWNYDENINDERQFIRENGE
jgi:hypothetical protein